MSKRVTGSIHTGKTLKEIREREKALYELSPDLIRFNRRKQAIVENKLYFVPTFNGKKIEKMKKQVKIEPIVNQIHWLDYV